MGGEEGTGLSPTRLTPAEFRSISQREIKRLTRYTGRRRCGRARWRGPEAPDLAPEERSERRPRRESSKAIREQEISTRL